MKPKIILTTIGVLLSPLAVADDEAPTLEATETWKCYSIFDYDHEKVLADLERWTLPPEAQDAFLKELGLATDLEVPDSLELGLVKVAGVEYAAMFMVEGFNREWVFGPNGADYMFQIKPDGTGHYFDFSNVPSGENTTSSQTYECDMS